MAPNSTIRKGDFFAVLEMQGRRDGMEDTSSTFGITGKEADQYDHSMLFGVYDGHGGEDCAMFCAENMCEAIAKHKLYGKDPRKALVESFQQVDDDYVKMAQDLTLDDGSTATVLQIHYNKKTKKCRYYLACAGDSRAILVRRNGEVLELSDDHVPFRTDERLRVEKDGGQVLFDDENGIYRVASPQGGGLAVTRAIGDMYFKPYVTSIPEVEEGQCGVDDLYICLASDGLWGDLTNKETGYILWEKGVNRGVKELANTAYLRGSEDNITIMVVDLQKAVKVLETRCASAPSSPLIVENGVNNNQDDTKEEEPVKDMAEQQRVARLSVRQRNISMDNSPPAVVPDILITSGRRSSKGDVSTLPSDASTTFTPMPSRTRKTSSNKSKRPSHPKRSWSTGSGGIWIVSGLEPDGFISELLLWKNPIRSGLWFITILLVFFLLNVVGYSLLTLTSYLLIIQLVGSVAIVHLEPFLKQFGLLSESFDSEVFILKSSIFTEDAIVRAGATAHQMTEDGLNTWQTIVEEGSTKSVLVALRNVSYVFTPIKFSNLLLIFSLALFSLPVTYVNNRSTMDAIKARFTAWWHRTTLTISNNSEPMLDSLAQLSSYISAALDSFFSMLGVINKKNLQKLISTSKSPELLETSTHDDEYGDAVDMSTREYESEGDY